MKRGFRVLALAAAVALGLLAVPASADEQQDSYLALGDSVAFGTNPLVTDPADPENFVGYPEVLAEQLDSGVVNAACPGETTMHFISITGLDDTCGVYRSVFPLHVSYSGSQLQYAVVFLQSHPHTTLVTLQVGADDLNAFGRVCGGSLSCIQNDVQTMSVPNLTTILATIRSLYTGTLVVMTYYARNSSPQEIQAVVQGNALITAIATPFQARIADAFGAFAALEGPSHDPCAAGLLIKLPNGTCDVHPTSLGQTVLAGVVLAQLPASGGAGD